MLLVLWKIIASLLFYVIEQSSMSIAPNCKNIFAFKSRRYIRVFRNIMLKCLVIEYINILSAHTERILRASTFTAEKTRGAEWPTHNEIMSEVEIRNWSFLQSVYSIV